MLSKRWIIPAAAALACLAVPAARADYSNAVLALNPVAYWPLTETTQPPASPVSVTAVNLGTLGADGDAPFTGDIVCGYPGALAGSTDAADSFNGFNARAEAPYSQQSSTSPPFTIEAWLLPHDDGTYWGTQCVLSDVDATSPRSGWLIYMDVANIGQYTFRTYATNGTSTSLSLNLGAAGSIKVGNWYHLAVVVSNSVTVTNVYGYINGALVAGPAVLPAYVPDDGQNGGGFTMGDRSDNSGYTSVTVLDEVAYYTNALDAATVLAHYQAGTNPAPATPYPTLVQQEHPVLYYRMDESTTQQGPTPGGLPVAANLGSFGALADGYYQSGTSPGLAGPTNAGFGATSYACGFSTGALQSSTTAGPGVLCAPYEEPSFNFTEAMTLTAWVRVPNSFPQWFQTVVGHADESYRLDVDTTGMPHFAANPNPDIVGTVALDDGLWHFWAGVVDPVAAAYYLYIDGTLAAQSAASPLLNMDCYLLIGGGPDYLNRNFVGDICHVAVFSNALSATQIKGLFNSVGTAPSLFLPVSQFSIDQNAAGGVSASVAGTEPLQLQWYYVDTSGNTNLAPGEIAATLSLTNVQPAQSGDGYFLIVNNAYGSVTSGVATLTVLSGLPQIQVDVTPASQLVPVGVPITYSVAVTGTSPFSYQWYMNTTMPIPGATNASYTLTAPLGVNTYGVTVINSAGQTKSATATLNGANIPPPVITLNGSGTDWAINGNVASAGIVNNVLTLTDDAGGEHSSAFFNTLQYIDGFAAFFTYQMSATNTPADGTTFCIQNSAEGTAALGGGGGGLGFNGITNSVAFELNLYPYAHGGTGIQFGTNGLTADTTPSTSPYFAPGSVNLISGDPINVRLYYFQGALDLLMTDATAKTSYSTALDIGSLRDYVGADSAYIGFTAATGGAQSAQTVSNFRFSYTTAPVLSVANNGAKALISWPATVATFFVLEQSSSLAGPWSNVSTSPVVLNGQNQVSVTSSNTAQFYRLDLQ
ncbi:MAG: LamG-like jellyroll fold domain-containing protein [Limisphaerales bacterium]